MAEEYYYLEHYLYRLISRGDYARAMESLVENIDLETTAEKIGSTFRCVTENEGRRMEFDGVVTRHDPPHLNTTQMTGESFDVEVEYRFEVLADRTRVTEISHITPKGIWLVIFFLFGWLLKSSSSAAAQEALDNLKVFCEEQGIGA